MLFRSDPERYSHIYYDFNPKVIAEQKSRWHGDQDYIHEHLPKDEIEYFDIQRVKSWRWECLDGGYNFEKKQHLAPNTGTKLTDLTSVLVFHGKPKPNDTTDSLIVCHWQ